MPGGNRRRRKNAKRLRKTHNQKLYLTKTPGSSGISRAESNGGRHGSPAVFNEGRTKNQAEGRSLKAQHIFSLKFDLRHGRLYRWAKA